MSAQNLNIADRQGEWIAASAPLQTPIAHEVALARELAVSHPIEFFDPRRALRSVQALAPNTRRAYRADWLAFVECCRLHHQSPLPATSAAIQTFIEWRSPEQSALVKEGKYKYVRAGEPRRPVATATLARALSAITAVHNWLGYANPIEDRDVQATFKMNTAGRLVQSHKDPLRWNDLERAFARMGTDLWSLRDKAMVAVAHSTMFRRSELVALTCEDFTRVPNTDHGRMLVRKTKTDDPKDRKYRHVYPAAVRHLETWLAAARITNGPLFRGITPDRRVKDTPLSAGEVARTFKVIARLAGIPDISRIGGHSTRIGATHDLKLFGADVLDIMQDGEWKSPMMPKRYMQGLESDRGAMARMMKTK